MEKCLKILRGKNYLNDRTVHHVAYPDYGFILQFSLGYIPYLLKEAVWKRCLRCGSEGLGLEPEIGPELGEGPMLEDGSGACERS